MSRGRPASTRVHFLRAVSPLLGDRVILIATESNELDRDIEDGLVFARRVDGFRCWMIDEAHEDTTIEVVERSVGEDEWCADCMVFEDRGSNKTCDAWDEIIDLGFETVDPLNKKEPAAMPDERPRFKIPEGLKQFLKKEGGALADFARNRAKEVVKEQAKAVGVTLDDQFFDGIYEAMFGGGSETISNGVKLSINDAAKILAVKWPCTKDEIIAGYRVMARSTHPDRPGGSADKFMRVAEARAVLLKALGE